MDDIHERFHWKVWVVVLVILFLIILFIIFLPILFSQRGSQQVNTKKPTFQTVPSAVQVSPQEKTEISSAPTQKNGTWISIDSPYYTVQAPQEWDISKRAVKDGGVYINMLPKNAQTTGEIFPRVDIEVALLRPETSAEVRARNLSVYNLPRSQAQFHGQQAIMLSGILPFPLKTGNPPIEKRVHKTYYLFDRGQYTYFIDYAYYADSTTAENTQLLQKILDSFRFK